jgi:hypothetical protein
MKGCEKQSFMTGRLGVGGSNPLAPTINLERSIGYESVPSDDGGRERNRPCAVGEASVGNHSWIYLVISTLSQALVGMAQDRREQVIDDPPRACPDLDRDGHPGREIE